MSERRKTPRIPLLAKVGAGVLAMAGLIAAAVFAPRLHWLGSVLLGLLMLVLVIMRINDRIQWRERSEANAKAYRDYMAAFGVKRTGSVFRRWGGGDFLG